MKQSDDGIEKKESWIKKVGRFILNCRRYLPILWRILTLDNHAANNITNYFTYISGYNAWRGHFPCDTHLHRGAQTPAHHVRTCVYVDGACARLQP